MGCCQCVYFQSAGPFKLARSLYNYINKEKKKGPKVHCPVVRCLVCQITSSVLDGMKANTSKSW